MLISSTDGVTIALHDLGGSGPPLLILHATGFHGLCYKSIGEGLTDIRHVIALDLRGHGDASTPSSAIQWSGMVDDTLAAVAHLGVDEPVDVVGHSMGGCAAVGAELRRPATVRSAWLFEPIIWPADEPRDGTQVAVVAGNRRPSFKSYAEAIERYGSRPPFDRIDPQVLADYVHHGFRETDSGVTLKCPPHQEASIYGAAPLDVFPRLEEVTSKVTIAGSSDGHPGARIAQRIADALPNGSFSAWPENSHFGPFEDPDRAQAEIRDCILSPHKPQ